MITVAEYFGHKAHTPEHEAAATELLERVEKLCMTLAWDSLTVLFSVLIAPELFKKLLNMKYGNGHEAKP